MPAIVAIGENGEFLKSDSKSKSFSVKSLFITEVKDDGCSDVSSDFSLPSPFIFLLVLIIIFYFLVRKPKAEQKKYLKIIRIFFAIIVGLITLTCLIGSIDYLINSIF